jgi:type II restriction enzyme
VSRLEEARRILEALGLPEGQSNDNAAYVLLAFASVGPETPWDRASNDARLGPHDVIQFVRREHGKIYAENTRETIRRQAIHQFVQAGVLVRNPDDPGLATNSPRTHYALTDEALAAVRAFGTLDFPHLAEQFRRESEGGLDERYAQRRRRMRVDVTLPSGARFKLSPGSHNELQGKVIEDFLPAFAPGTHVLYLGDTDRKALHVESDALARIGVPLEAHDKLPDILVYDEARDRLILCEAVTSHGPVSPKRRIELEEHLSDCRVTRMYVSAFLSFAEFKRHAESIAWATEVWIAEAPTHMLHYNGEEFLR